MTADSTTDMAATLLQYANPVTSPAPLSIGATGATITIVASNPGGFSDNPAEDYVDVSDIVLNFGVAGGGGPDLTTDPSAVSVQPPTYIGQDGQPKEWEFSRDGLRFTFTPPRGGSEVFTKDGLSFTFSDISVNDTLGTVELDIIETASSPGDPANPTLYPPLPKRARYAEFSLGKFPSNFQVGSLNISSAHGKPGFSPTLSWSGSDATYALSFGAHIGQNAITHHADGTPLRPVDTYPDPGKGDSKLSIELDTLFVLAVMYTPPHSSNTLTTQRFAWARVLRPAVVNGTFIATPQPITYGDKVTLHWQTEYADACEIITNHSGDKVAANSDEQIPPYSVAPRVNQTFTLVARAGAVQTDPVSLAPVLFKPLSFRGFSANPPSVVYGEAVELKWNVSSAVSVLINGSPVTGSSLSVKPTESQAFTIDCHGPQPGNPGNHVTKSVDVGVNVLALSDVSFQVGSHSLSIMWKAAFQQRVDVAFRWSQGSNYVDETFTDVQFNATTNHGVGVYEVNLNLSHSPANWSGVKCTATLTIYGPGPGGKLSKTSTWTQRSG